ncbi:MAG: TlpA family protein disulfide reductase [Verrucomicrobiaceae bacterium]
MNNEHLNRLLKEHYNTRKMPNSQARKILAECEIARTAYRWRVRAIGAFSLAATALLALAITLYGNHASDPSVESLAQSPPDPVNTHQKLVAIMIHATNCPNSQAMAPVFAELQEEFVDESVLFIKFDYSSDCAKHQAELLSKDLGLGLIFEDYKRTGDIILVSSRGEVRGVMNRGVTIASATTTLRANL